MLTEKQQESDTSQVFILRETCTLYSETPESQIGFEPTTLIDLVGCSNHRATMASNDQIAGIDWNRIAGLHTHVLTGTYELTNSIAPSHVPLIAQLVEHCTGNAKVMGSNPVQSLNFFRSFFQ